MEGLDLGLFVFAGFGDGAGFGLGRWMLRSGHCFAKIGYGLNGCVGAGEIRRAGKGTGERKEARGGTEGRHCGKGG